MIATITHARVRASQGDLAGALRVLQGVLTMAPGDAEALRLRDELRRALPDDRRRRARSMRAWIERLRSRRGVAR